LGITSFTQLLLRGTAASQHTTVSCTPNVTAINWGLHNNRQHPYTLQNPAVPSLWCTSQPSLLLHQPSLLLLLLHENQTTQQHSSAKVRYHNGVISIKKMP
jgi:hypothetical protein